MKRSRGFSLIELLVVMAIIAILTSISFVGMQESRKRSRDIDRQSDLRLMQNAIELYKQKNGRYPAGCNGANRWSAQTVSAASINKCSSGNQYITGLAPEFISVLPIDASPNGDNSGYMYYTNTDGSAYKLIAYKTVESETVTNSHEFKACEIPGTCEAVRFNAGNTAPHCSDGDIYAVWGGYPLEPFPPSHARGYEQLDNVICRIP